MPDLPRLPTADSCPACPAGIGERHDPDCRVAICVSTGHQRLLHHDQVLPPICVDIHPGQPIVGGAPLCHLGCGIPVWRHSGVHICGEDVWTGVLPGAAEAVAAGLFVYRDADGPWTPCPAGTPGAVPDLARVVQLGTWDPIQQRWDLPAEVSCA